MLHKMVLTLNWMNSECVALCAMSDSRLVAKPTRSLP